MIQFVKYIAMALALASTALLSACGGSGKTPAAMIEVNNLSASDFSHLDITTRSGNVVYNGDFVCAAGKTCQLPLDHKLASESLTFQFHDKTQKLVAAYGLFRPRDTYNHITTTPVMLGIHLFDQLRIKNTISAELLSKKLDNYFRNIESPDGTPDFFEELGLHYVGVTDALDATGPTTADKFLSDLYLKLARDDVLPQPIGGPTPVKLAQVGASACPEGVGTFMSFMKFVAGLIPVPGVAPVVDLTAQVTTDACGSSETVSKLDDIAAKLDKMTQLLNQIDVKLDSMDYKMDVITNEIAQADSSRILVGINSTYEKLDTITTQYISLLAPMYGKSGFQNLASLVDAQGGLGQTMLAENGAVAELLKSLGAQQDLFTQLADKTNLLQLSSSLATLCGNPKTMSTEVFNQRLKCNLVINQVVSRVTAIESMANLMMKDEINTLDQAFVRAATLTDQTLFNWLRTNYPVSINGAKSWNEAQPLLSAEMQGGLDGLASAFNNRMYVPTDGLPVDLLNALVQSASCKLSVGTKTLPGLTTWYANTPDKKPYIETQCWDGYATIKSRFFYEESINNNIVNVMGVPVRCGSNGSNCLIYARGSTEDISSSQASGRDYDYLDTSMFTLLTPNTVLVNNQDLTNNYSFTVYPGALFTYGDGQYMTRYADSVATDSRYAPDKWSLYKTKLIGRSDIGKYRSLMRYVDATGYAYVWQLDAWQSRDLGGTSSAYYYATLHWTQGCIVGTGCLGAENGNGTPSAGIAFNHGPKISWNTKGFINGDYTVYMVVDGKQVVGP